MHMEVAKVVYLTIGFIEGYELAKELEKREQGKKG